MHDHLKLDLFIDYDKTEGFKWRNFIEYISLESRISNELFRQRGQHENVKCWTPMIMVFYILDILI